MYPRLQQMYPQQMFACQHLFCLICPSYMLWTSLMAVAIEIDQLTTCHAESAVSIWAAKIAGKLEVNMAATHCNLKELNWRIIVHAFYVV